MLKNIFANYAGRTFQVLLGLIVTPTYLRLLGIESYGLIGLFSAVQALLYVADLGLSATLNREFARRAGDIKGQEECPSVLRTFETVYWAVSIAVGLSVALASPFLAGWLKNPGVPREVISRSMALMGLIMSVQGPISLYGGGMLGLQKQVQYNVLGALYGLLRHAGGVLVLLLFRPSIVLLFSHYFVAGIAAVALHRSVLVRMLPRIRRTPKFQWSFLSSSKAFTIGMSMNVLLGMALASLDKVVLSRTLPLRIFGYYCLAATVACSLSMVSSPFFVTVFPRFTALRSSGKSGELVSAYKNALQGLQAILIPSAITLMLFSKSIVLAWTGDPATAEATWAPMALLAAGWMFNGIAGIPYALELSTGRADLNVKFNIALLLSMAPALTLSSLRYGVIAGGATWMALNFLYVSIYSPLACTRAGLPGVRFFHFRALLPLSVALAVGGLARVAGAGELTGRLHVIPAVAATWLAAVILAGSSVSAARQKVLDFAHRYFSPASLIPGEGRPIAEICYRKK